MKIQKMPGAIQARLGFSRRDDEPSAPGDIGVPGYPDNRVVPVACTIRNARLAGTSINKEGFELATHRSAFTPERDRSVLARGYHAEMAAFLTDYLGASVVLPSGESALLVRYGERLVGRGEFDRPTDIIDDRIPASFAHLDYYPQSAIQSADHVAPGLSGYSRMMIIQTWRAVSGSPQDVPLALCDRRWLEEGDISPRTGILAPENAPAGADPAFTVGGIHHNASQKWYYFPDMEPEEVLLFTGYDSASDDGWKVAHAAFDNRHNQSDGIARVSIEARFYAWFG